jgi:hypothetical protein
MKRPTKRTKPAAGMGMDFVLDIGGKRDEGGSDVGLGTISKGRGGRLRQTTYHIPDQLSGKIKEEAEKTKASISGFAAVLLAHALEAYLNGEINIEQFQIDKSTSPRYLYTWDFVKIDSINADN